MLESLVRLFLTEAPAKGVHGQLMSPDQALRLALAEAFRGYGTTAPNPPVGCVILDRENRFLASGYHRRAGEPHAEIEALMALRPGGAFPRDAQGWDLASLNLSELQGAKVFVTLEPCAHQGRTPSCAQTLARLPIAEVTAILRDPDPRVAGRGLQILRDAGQKVACVEEQDATNELLVAARAVCEFFLTNVQKQRPFIALKVATSLDGMMGMQNGESQWITGTAARDFARFLRGAHDACLVGKKTILQDDPRLDARQTPFADAGRKLIVLDSQGEVFRRPDLNIFKVHRPENIWVFVGADAAVPDPAPARILRVSSKQGIWAELLSKLWSEQIRSLWIEGGATTLSGALAAGVGDRLWLFQGPSLLGARFGRPWTEMWGPQNIDEKRVIDASRRLPLGDDLLTTGSIRLSKP